MHSSTESAPFPRPKDGSAALRTVLHRAPHRLSQAPTALIAAHLTLRDAVISAETALREAGHGDPVGSCRVDGDWVEAMLVEAMSRHFLKSNCVHACPCIVLACELTKILL